VTLCCFFVVVLIAALVLATASSLSWGQQFSGGSFAYRAQNPATVYVAPGFCIFLSPRALTHDPRALPQSFRASEIASAERQGSRKRPDAGHDQPTKARPFANSEEPRRLFSVRLTCRHGRMSTDIERPRPRIVPRRQIARP
jgi:hypothetical protein